MKLFLLGRHQFRVPSHMFELARRRVNSNISGRPTDKPQHVLSLSHTLAGPTVGVNPEAPNSRGVCPALSLLNWRGVHAASAKIKATTRNTVSALKIEPRHPPEAPNNRGVCPALSLLNWRGVHAASANMKATISLRSQNRALASQ